jgi:hypothetical protein
MRVFLALDPKDVERLVALARAERRTPQAQAALMVARALDEQERPSRSGGAA